MFSRRTEYFIAGIAIAAPFTAAMMWIAKYWIDQEFPGVLKNLPYLYIFFGGIGLLFAGFGFLLSGLPLVPRQ